MNRSQALAKVQDIMTTEVTTLDQDVSLRDALEILRSRNVSGAPVLRGQRVVGVVSTTDLLEFTATTPGVPTSRAAESEWGGFEEPEVWEEGSDSPSTFFVDYWVDAGAELGARFDEPESPEWDVLAERYVAEVMTRKVVAVPATTELHEAARLMLEAGVHRLLVMEKGQLQGIVSTSDIVRAVAERKT